MEMPHRDCSLQVNLNAAPSKPRPFNKDKTMEEYDEHLDKVKRLALVSTGIFSLNWFLGVCALTWATAVILGGLLPQLGGSDFYCISALLLLEALRLAAATFFGNLVIRKLIYRSTLPALITYDDKDRHHVLAFARVLDLTSQLLVLAISCFLSLVRLRSLPRQSSSDLGGVQGSPSPAPSQQPSSAFDGQYHGLRIFYILVLLNAIVAAVGALFSKILVPWFTTSFSLRRYYDHIVWRGMEKGFLYITDFDFLAFAFKALADEYRRNLRASVVYKLYSDLIDYLYAHHRGFDAARIAMDSDDQCQQEAAANIVGLWARLEGAAPSLLLQSRLLTKLADALDHQETGRAATCSFESLAKILVNSEVDQGLLLEVTNGKGERLMEIMCNCVSKAVKVKKHDKALVFIKVLIQLLKSDAGQQERQRQSISGSIVEDLKSVFKGEGCKKRTVGVAGKALQQMNAGMSPEEVEEYLNSPQPSEEEHILEDEEKYILELLGIKSLPQEWKKVNPRHNTRPQGSLSYANGRVCFTVLALVAVIVVIVAVILCLYFIHF